MKETARKPALTLMAMFLSALLLLQAVSPPAGAARSNNVATVSVADACPNYTAPSQTAVPALTFTIRDSANNEDFTQVAVNYTGTNISDI